MKRRWCVAVGVVMAVVAGLPAPAGAEPAGDLQVTCWPGYRVYVDGRFAGLTTVDEDGLYLRDVAAGRRLIRVEKLGHQAVEDEVQVVAGEVVELQIVPDRTDRPDGPPTPPRPGPDEGVSQPDAPVATPPEPVQAPETTVTHEAAQTPAAAEVLQQTAADDAVAPARHSGGLTPVIPDAATTGSDLPVIVRQIEAERDVMFVYRARGRSIEGGGRVAIHRERGGPRAPVVAFVCVDRDECLEQTKATFAPGSYRFRAVCRRPGERRGETLFVAERAVEVEAEAGATYLVDVGYDGDSTEQCTASITRLEVD